MPGANFHKGRGIYRVLILSCLASLSGLVAFFRAPTVFSCESTDVCECLHVTQFREWYEKLCALPKNYTATNVTTNVDDDMLDKVDVLAVIIAILTAIAMVTLIWLSVILSRYRRRNQVVVMLEGEMKAAQQSMSEVKRVNSEALADNARLKKSLRAAQQIVDRNVKEGGAALAAYKLRQTDLTTDVQLGEGSFGTVYHGTYRGSECAVKTVRATKVTDKW